MKGWIVPWVHTLGRCDSLAEAWLNSEVSKRLLKRLIHGMEETVGADSGWRHSVVDVLRVMGARSIT